MPFKSGESGNPRGRPVGSGSGRTRVLSVLDQILSEADSLEAMHAAFMAEFKKSPVRFFRQIVMPLLPREAVTKLMTDEPRVVVWKRLMDNPPAESPPTVK